MNQIAYHLSNTIAKNNYNLSCSHPVADISEKKEIITMYKPTNEERRFTRMIALEKLERWEQYLILGGCLK
jgi:hypothetical protein